jgi:hypothetical protein
VADSEDYPATGSPGLKGRRERGFRAGVKYLMIANAQGALAPVPHRVVPASEPGPIISGASCREKAVHQRA